MTDKKPTGKLNTEEMGSASRRDFMKVAGIGALGLAYASPLVETLSGGSQLTNYDPPQGGGSSSSSHHRDGSSSSSWPRRSSSENGDQAI